MAIRSTHFLLGLSGYAGAATTITMPQAIPSTPNVFAPISAHKDVAARGKNPAITLTQHIRRGILVL